MTYVPGVTCPAEYRDVKDANECQRLAIQYGHTFEGKLTEDGNWIHGCFEWYDTKYADGGNPKGSFLKVYWNERPGATEGVYGGHKPCVYNPQ
ncbi:hypothetical protein EMIHUDRAFT_373688 [Emiliania huxleyi CCMP1516]|uniref:C-type lectin domain-containing protein n=2 Tax=Emiliania huxleyi TaxID=2903 RepID=A0A0D3JWX3_EMIH1|nr:hypothetical protein EMIHUDRAFT_373688 [Emiliania huxleyi CCMP1516]EOD28008.1 hypothetical protein EMIHUDRAFT_373688 [Emiliania huxleyi CCMP1516]|eukprot:XP_005780437.1 hypothetical protein EMIHUDRAFT_373688 [Emiliania huxleyi CCMP1516]